MGLLVLVVLVLDPLHRLEFELGVLVLFYCLLVELGLGLAAVLDLDQVGLLCSLLPLGSNEFFLLLVPLSLEL